MNRVVAILVIVVLAGCASHPATTQPTTRIVATTQADPKSLLTLDEILPRPTLPAAPAAPNSPAPIKSLVLYAKGMDELFSHKPYDAVQDLIDALKYDPDSYEVNYALGRAHLDRTHLPNDRAFEAFERAAAIRPDDVQIHLLLGREYFADGKFDKAIEHLRLAMQTSEYPHDQAAAAAVDLFLARALLQQGYDRAALDRFVSLDQRLSNSTAALRNDPDVGFLVSSPEWVSIQIGQLYEKHGQFAEALSVYQPMAKSDDSNFDLQAKVVRLMVVLGDEDTATKTAASLMERFRASVESVNLLREVYQGMGRQSDLVKVLQRIHSQNPAERGILFALSDVLVEQGKFPEAKKLMEDSVAKSPGDLELTGKLFDLYLSHDDTESAARVLIVFLAAQPDLLREIDPWLEDLIRPWRSNALHISMLQRLQVPPQAQAARLYLIARLALIWQRDVLARSSLEQAVEISPPFAPAYRARVMGIWDLPDFDVKQKKEASEALAASAQKRGANSLAAEVRGLSLLSGGDLNEAAEQFSVAENLGGNSADFQLVYASVLRKLGERSRCEQKLRKLVAQRPRYDEAWQSLYNFFLDAGQDGDAAKVLLQWIKADPGSAAARLREAFWLVKQRELPSASALLYKIVEDHPDDLEVLQTASGFYRAMSQSDLFFQKLEAIRMKQPRNFTLISWLVNEYNNAHRLADATRLLDETRTRVGDDPELLYQLSGLYLRLGQPQVSQDLLASVIQKDPTNGPASNDLGFAWADEGKNLDRAEQLIRVAIAAEPDNQAFLDSMGWVLYKRGKFEEAAKYFEQAIGPAALPDPEILDHYGDALYRLSKTAEAQKQWKRSLDRLEERESASAAAGELRLHLKQKLQDATAGKPVGVAPVVENVPSSDRTQK